MRPSDDELDRLLREAAPRAPAGTVDAALRRIRRERAANRRVIVAMSCLALAAAAVLLLVVWPRTPPAGGFRTVAGAMLREGELRAIAAGERLVLRHGTGEITVEGAAEVRARGGTLAVTSGRGRLTGDGTTIETPPARLTAIGEDADVIFELRRLDMTGKQAMVGAATAAGALLAVHVLAGGAKVEAAGASAPTWLAAGDRALVGAGQPPLALRTHAGSGQAVARAASTQTSSDRVQAPRPSGSPYSPAARPLPPTVPSAEPPPEAAPGALDKDTIRAGIKAILPDVKDCYEKALAKHPNLSGRLVLEMKIRPKDGVGRIDEADVVPHDGPDELDSPEAEHCILNAMTKATFPAPEGGGEVVVRYPFVLLDKPPPGHENDRDDDEK